MSTRESVLPEVEAVIERILRLYENKLLGNAITVYCGAVQMKEKIGSRTKWYGWSLGDQPIHFLKWYILKLYLMLLETRNEIPISYRFI